MKMGKVEWKFLAFGNSQNREGGVYFIHKVDDVVATRP